MKVVTRLDSCDIRADLCSQCVSCRLGAHPGKSLQPRLNALGETWVKAIRQGKHCGGEALPGEGIRGVGRVIGKVVTSQNECQGSLTNQHTNFLGEKALGTLESREKYKRSIHLSLSFPICKMGIISPSLGSSDETVEVCIYGRWIPSIALTYCGCSVTLT